MVTIACVDVGSTFTKAALIDVDDGVLLATASHRTTIDTDVMDGVRGVLTDVGAQVPSVVIDEVRACSSAGGGLRLAVVGYERIVTAEAGRQVGLSAGAKVVHVAAGVLDPPALTALEHSKPDIVLLCGGTDGGNVDVLLANAETLAVSGLRVPVVIAGNVDVRDRVTATLTAAGITTLPTANVLPRIGVLDPGPARAAIRDVFITHVIGGKGLSSDAEFPRLVRAATPDAVLTGVELLADGAATVDGVGDVVVIDVGGATTDVYSVVTPDPEESVLHREVVEVMWRARTVEGDLGMRSSARGVVDAAVDAQLFSEAGAGEVRRLRAAADLRSEHVDLLPDTSDDAEQFRDDDAQLARLALTLALRRHAAPSDSADGVRTRGRDLRDVSLVVGSGGVFRHADRGRLERMLGPARTDFAGGWLLPEHASLAIDKAYVLAAAGLLANDYPEAAMKVLRTELVDNGHVS